MRYPPSLLDEIRARMPVSTVVGRRVKLVKSGREWKGLSPFNAEKTPSFFVNDQKGRFFDFSSGKDGDIFNFVMETEGLSFPEAVERLAQDAGVALPKVSADMEAQEKRRAGLHEIMELAGRFFEDNLRGGAGAEARRYLLGRELGPAAQAEFRIGYAAADRFALRNHLAGKDVAADDMIEAGLLIQHEDVAVPYDRFRDRIMFPIADARGRIIAFGGRAMQKDAQAKYLNSPETPLFHKGHNLYNQHKARKAAHDLGFVVVVEGYVDVIAMARAGFPNAVAPLGTALTEEQMALLWRMTPEPILCFDGDKAGQRAAHRAIDIALPQLGPGRTLRFAFLPAGQDPDDLLRSAGPAAVARVVETPQPLVEVLWAREFERGPLATPEQRADLERRLRALLTQIGDETLRKYYRVEIGQRLAALSGPAAQIRQPYRLRMAAGQSPRMAGMRQGPVSTSLITAPMQPGASLRGSALFGRGPSYAPREVALVVAAINHPEMLHSCAEILAELEFSTPDLARIAAFLVDFASNSLGHDSVGLRAHIQERGLARELERAEKALNAAEWWARPDAALFDAEMAWKQAADLHHKVRTLHKELREVEAECGRDESESSFQRLRAMQVRLTVLEENGEAVENFSPKAD